MVSLTFENGTIIAEGAAGILAQIPGMVLDQRIKKYRAAANQYRSIIMHCRDKKIAVTDSVRQYQAIDCTLKKPISPRPHQMQALKSWLTATKQGVVQLPTGAGKTYLAILAMVKSGRSTLILVPTIDLMNQWHEVLSNFLNVEIGMLGGGQKDIFPVTVSTYDSAVLFIERIGNKFGLLIADECHHLPAPQYQNIALGCIAPFRLGLSATVERADGKESEIYRLMGDLVFEGRIDEMVDDVLAPYDVVNIQVPMSEVELELYTASRKIYTDFIKRAGVNFSSPNGWQDFIIRAARLPGGREAMRAYRDQKTLAQGASAKLKALWEILQEYPEDRAIVFTEDNNMAYKIGRTFILAVLTHQTKLKERKRMLAAFRQGEINVLVTSKVLNEGVDVPEAGIGIVISGSGGVREHVQRLGRILRHQPGKRAKLFEVVSKGTSEYYVNQRRRQHHAYKGSTEISS